MSKHTPGPWFVEADGAGVYVMTETMMVASPSPMDRHPTDSDEYIDGPETEANARLIAAAPDLLDALQAIEPFIPTTSAADGGAAAYSANVRAADMVRAAIAKATGSAS